MPVTRADVARLAGVSPRTVTNVVNKFPYVSDTVVARVTAAIEELGYIPSHAARSLRSGRSGILQLVVPELDVPYFAELARGIVVCAEEHGLSVLVRQTLGDGRREQEALDGAAAEYAEGTILSAVADVGDLLRARRSRTPVVLIGERAGGGLVDHVGIDDVAAATCATAHLTELGRRRVAFIGDTNESLRMAQLRLTGYRAALAAAGLDFDPDLVIRTDSYHRGDGERAMRALLETGDPPDAVFCATDLLALGALRVAYELGVRVPQDVAVVGWDGLEEGRYSVPTLTTVAPDKRALARVSVDTLLARIAGPERGQEPDPVREIPVPFELVVRESSAIS